MKSIHPLSGAGMLLVASGLLHGQTLDPQSPDLTFGPPPFESDSDDQSFFDNPIALSSGDDLFTDTVADDPIMPHYAVRFGYEYMLADYDLTGGAAKYWTGDPASVGRIQTSIEGPEGYGVRAQSWSFESYSRLDEEPLEVRVASFYIDGYRRFTGERGELLLGGGLAIGSRKIDSPVEDSVLRFNGLGASLAGEGFYSLLSVGKTDFGVSGRARLALLGPLQDNFGDSQAMLVDELGVGIELRRRFGKREDKMFFVRLGREYQHWSDIESPLAFDQNVQGTSLTMGLAWWPLLASLARWYEPAEILTMATSTGADLLTLTGKRNPYEGKLGVVEEGALADLLLVDGNPLEDITLLADPEKNFTVIMKDGTIAKNTLK